MFGVIRALFFGAVALVVLIPLGILLAVIGLPIMAVLGLLALPVLLVLFLIGLPLLILFAVFAALLGTAAGVVGAFLSVGVVAIKFAMVGLVAIFVLCWVARLVFGPRQRVGMDY